ncbi:MAG: helix-turn-helix domain-containing protein [Bacteroidetes bacterium]|nr:helix-turn-helix domain-containing protein [Bacteroidota bacterium]
MTTQTLTPISLRQKEIVKEYLAQLDKHIEDLRNGLAERTQEIRDFADLMHIHPTHLSNTISLVMRKSPCNIYEQKLTDLAKELLLSSNRSIAQIAKQLDFDPSNFTKFFKLYEGVTPKKFREANWALKN